MIRFAEFTGWAALCWALGAGTAWYWAWRTWGPGSGQEPITDEQGMAHCPDCGSRYGAAGCWPGACGYFVALDVEPPAELDRLNEHPTMVFEAQPETRLASVVETDVTRAMADQDREAEEWLSRMRQEAQTWRAEMLAGAK